MLVAWGVFILLWQFTEGLGVTGLGRPVYWGIYITNFVFFIGISHAGTLISAILRVTGANWRRPITRIAEAVTVFALVCGLLMILIDMGRLDRVLNVISYGRFQSVFLWDFTCISIYLTSSITYLYLPMIPDFARLRDQWPDAPGWRKWLYKTLAMGWKGNHEQLRRLEKSIGFMALAIIPIAVSVHTVVSWIFGMTTQPMWHSTIFGPYFVVGAIFSGIAVLFVAMALMRKAYHLEPWLTAKQFDYLGILFLVMSIFWSYFTFSEYLTTWYGALAEEMPVIDSKLRFEYAWAFYLMVFCNGILPFVVLIRQAGRTVKGTFFVSLFVIVGMWLERFTIVVPTLSRPRLGWQAALYAPTWQEASVTIGALSLFALLFLLFFKIFPSMAIWEVEEGLEIEERNALNKELSLHELAAAAHAKAS